MNTLVISRTILSTGTLPNSQETELPLQPHDQACLSRIPRLLSAAIAAFSAPYTLAHPEAD
jgi:hypothetical protein